MSRIINIQFPFLFLSFLISFSVYSQEYSYTHYDVQDGLAGSTVYCMTQDAEGFIWMGTEAGVSRFDGTHFTNFAVADGLPDIEVLQIYTDSKGRVWMAPFNHSICYYYKGRIYNRDNDSMLKKIHLESNIEHFAEDNEGNVLMNERRRLHLVCPDRSVREYDSAGGQPIDDCVAIGSGRSPGFRVQVKGTLYDLYHDRFRLVRHILFPNINTNFIEIGREKIANWEGVDVARVSSFATGESFILPFNRRHYQHNTFSMIGDSLLFDNGVNGSTETNLRTRAVRQFLSGIDIARVFKDDEGNTWFASLGQGIYRLNSENFRLLPLYSKKSTRCSVCSIQRIDNTLMVGCNYNTSFRMQLPALQRRDLFNPSSLDKASVSYIGRIAGGKYFCGTSENITANTADLKNLVLGADIAVKALFRKDSNTLIIANARGVFSFDINKWRVTDTLWHERATAVYYRSDTFYIGTLNGLYVVSKNGYRDFPGSRIPFLANRIADIVESPDHTLWISSYDKNGVIGYRYGRQVAVIGAREGLNGDVCRTMYLHDNILWIGTDKGLNRVELMAPGRPITRYTTDDGLGSNTVNTIFVDGSTVYVGTPAGLNFFADGKQTGIEKCRLVLLSVINGGRNRMTDTGHLVVPYTDKRIRFDFAAISYRSARDLHYHYRLAGLDSNWQTATENSLEYQSLPSGSYRLQLMAVNKFGLDSPLVSVAFTIPTPYWQTTWFYILVGFTFFSLTWSIAWLRIKIIRRRQHEKNLLTQRMKEMEHKALQAQMNPHFIFNCLNSIQHIIFDRDIEAANKYISGFARLIRATLHHSSQSLISVTEEADYLSTYLSLEKMRFKDKMDYFIEIDPAIDKGNTFLPPMLIQPYVENSMRHGLRHKVKGKGYIRVMMRRSGQGMVVTVEDNGIGREKAMKYKTSEHIEYQSKGMVLTAERIKMIGAIYDNNIDVRVEDIITDSGEAAGTRVVINLPEF